MNRYAYRRAASARFYGGVTADEVGEELTRIWQANDGRLSPGDVVEEARPEGAVLHPCFEWDDQRAAEAHRNQQARQLIKSVYIKTAKGGSEPAFVHVWSETETPKHFYQTPQVLREQPAQYLAALALAKRKLEEAMRSFEEVKQIVELEGRDDDSRQKLVLIAEALATAHAVAARLM